MIPPLGQYIKRQRWQHEMCQEAVAFYLDIEQSSFSRRERGIHPFTIGQFIKLAKVFGMKPDEMMKDWLATYVNPQS